MLRKSSFVCVCVCVAIRLRANIDIIRFAYSQIPIKRVADMLRYECNVIQFSCHETQEKLFNFHVP